MNRYESELVKAGIPLDDPRAVQTLELLSVIDSREVQPRHQVVDLFGRLARGENLPDARAERWEGHAEGLAHWQHYALECFPRETFYDIPEPIRSLSALWRYSSYELLVTDVLHTGSIMATTLLSLLFQPKVIVEMGVHAGFTTLLWCRLNPEAKVIGVDRSLRMHDVPLPVGYVPLMHDVGNLEIVACNSWEYATHSVDMCLVDADHTGEAPYLDSWRAWRNRPRYGDWCIVWDDYHPSNPDVVSGVDRFCAEVGYPLQKLYAWYWIGTKTIGEEELKRVFT